MARIGDSAAASVGVAQNRIVLPGDAESMTFANSDFGELDAPKKQANAMIYGDGGTGKTTFATMYAPDPVAFINFDNRAHHAVMRAKEAGRKIHYVHVPLSVNAAKLNPEAARAAGQTAVDMVERNFEIAVRESQRGNCRSICLDTGTEFDEMLKIAVRGRADMAKGDFGKSKDLMNRSWWRLLNMAREGNAHFILLARAKAIWENNEPTGKFAFRGPEVMNDGVDWAAHIRLRKARAGRLKKEFEMEITKAGVNIAELNAVYKQEEWEAEGMGGPFCYACMMQYPGTLPEDWQ